MKKIIFISIVISLIATVAVASGLTPIPGSKPKLFDEPMLVEEPQPTNYYPGATGTITKSGYTYKYRNAKISGVDVQSDLELYNSANPYLNVKWGYKDGSEMPADKALGMSNKSDFSDSSLTIAQTYAAVQGCFTSTQKASLKGKSMFIECRIDPSTGKIADVYFNFFRNGPFVNIPVETYRSIKLALKQKLTVTVTAEGRKLNYILLYWSQKF